MSYNYKDIRVGAKIYFLDAANNSAEHQLLIPNRITFAKQSNKDIIDGLEAGNQGYNVQYKRYTFTVSIPIHTDSARLMENLEDLDQEFSIELFNAAAVDTATGNNYKIFGEKLNRCTVISSDRSIVVNEVTYQVFSCIALEYDRQIVDPADVDSGTLKYISLLAGHAFGASKPEDVEAIRQQIMDEWTTSV